MISEYDGVELGVDSISMPVTLGRPIVLPPSKIHIMLAVLISSIGLVTGKCCYCICRERPCCTK